MPASVYRNTWYAEKSMARHARRRSASWAGTKPPALPQTVEIGQVSDTETAEPLAKLVATAQTNELAVALPLAIIAARTTEAATALRLAIPFARTVEADTAGSITPSRRRMAGGGISRRFTRASGDYLTYPITSLSNFTGAFSWAIVARRRSLVVVGFGEWQALITHQDVSGLAQVSWGWTNGGGFSSNDRDKPYVTTHTHSGPRGDEYPVAITSLDDWYLFGVSYDGVAEHKGRFHIQNLSAGTAMDHQDAVADGMTPAPSQAGGVIALGMWEGFEFPDMNVYADAGWAASLSDAQFDALVANRCVTDWLTIGDPAWVHRHNQYAASDTIRDLTGNGHDSSFIDGTTFDLDTGPPGWADPALETDSAGAITAAKTVAVGQAVETDTAGVVNWYVPLDAIRFPTSSVPGSSGVWDDWRWYRDTTPTALTVTDGGRRLEITSEDFTELWRGNGAGFNKQAIDGTDATFTFYVDAVDGNAGYAVLQEDAPGDVRDYVQLDWDVGTGTWRLWHRLDGAVDTDPLSAPDDRMWLRIVESAGAIVVQTAPDGLAWTTHYSGATFSGWDKLQLDFGLTDGADQQTNRFGINLPVPQAATVTQATETDTAGAITSTKQLAIAQAADTETAGLLTPVQTGGAQTIAVAQALEADTSSLLAPLKVKALVGAGELDSATVVSRLKSRAAAQTLEVDTARAVAATKAKQIAQASEADTAATVAHAKLRALAAANETDTAGVVTIRGRANIAIETDTARPAGKTKLLAFLRAAETSLATAVGRLLARVLGQPQEADSAQTVAKRKVKATAQAAETDTGTAVSSARAFSVARAAETDSTSSMYVVTPLGIVVEVDFAAGVLRPQAAFVEPATELDVARPVFDVLGEPPPPGHRWVVTGSILRRFETVVEGVGTFELAGTGSIIRPFETVDEGSVSFELAGGPAGAERQATIQTGSIQR